LNGEGEKREFTLKTASTFLGGEGRQRLSLTREMKGTNLGRGEQVLWGFLIHGSMFWGKEERSRRKIYLYRGGSTTGGGKITPFEGFPR